MHINDIPQGSVISVVGAPGSGKKWIALDAIGRMHKNDDKGIAILIDTEWRGYHNSYLEQFDVDQERLLICSLNEIDDIFKNLEHIDSLCHRGAPIKTLVVDSVNGIVRSPDLRPMEAVLFEMASLARRHKITLILLSQIRREVMLGTVTLMQPQPMTPKDVADYIVRVDACQIVEITHVIEV